MARCRVLWAVLIPAALVIASVQSLAAAGKTSPAPPREVQAALSRLTVGVIPFEGPDEELAGKVTDLLSAYLTAAGEVDLVERAKLSQVLEELGMGQAGLIDPVTAQRVGYLVGAQALVMGRIFELDRDTYVVARLVGVETGRVFVLEQNAPVSEKVAPLAKELASGLIRTMEAKRKTLVAPEVSINREAMLAELTDSLKGKSKPGVMVDIPEVHYGSAAVDPAVETELILWLKRAGFEVFDPKGAVPALSKLPPEVKVVITGEAFSEAAGEFGRFKAVKVRIEVRAVDRNSGKIVAIARRVGVLADLSERVAAKKALSDEAASIAYELIPILVNHAPAPTSTL